ncbi:hypothetical protein BLNAU_21530 [Blattamonas nauphoetae]|uniref:C2H2-type domain-containing protein n=1 Tax=Blattamonas nauphoetae TaxID=2049346 RepID=A0ABQ9WW37_9EUKA|nr:hypothetical protein BLNAU_21530 [Blattamonas nauphoetae]
MSRKRQYEPEFICKMCGTSVQTAEELKAHIATHTEERPYKCRYCDKTFPVAASRNRHIQAHFRPVFFICIECGQKFYTKQQLIDHEQFHVILRPYECKYCHRRYRQLGSKNRHEWSQCEKRADADTCDKKPGTRWTTKRTNRIFLDKNGNIVDPPQVKPVTPIKDPEMLFLDFDPYVHLKEFEEDEASMLTLSQSTEDPTTPNLDMHFDDPDNAFTLSPLNQQEMDKPAHNEHTALQPFPSFNFPE